MAKAAYQQILTAGLNIYLLSRFSFDAGIGSELISGLDQGGVAPETDQPGGFWALTPAAISVKAFRQVD